MVFVVAEIGVNWDGDPKLVKNMMEFAKKIGCDAVKFQAFDKNIVKDHPESSRLMKSTISKDNIELINNLAKSIGIEWFCTPMYPEIVDILDPYVKRFKIRELDGRNLLKNNTTPLLEKVLSTGKEIIVSSQISPRNCKFYGNSQIKWLYCVPKYPCNIHDLDFREIRDFNGYSNHCILPIAPITASILGSKIIEMHVTSDKTQNFVDNNVSFDYNELEELVRMIRLTENLKR